MRHSERVLKSDVAELNSVTRLINDGIRRYPILVLGTPIIVVVVGAIAGLIIGARFTWNALLEV